MFHNLMVLAQSSGDGSAGGAGLISVLCSLVIAVIFIAAAWRLFTKAGKPGWAAIIPIYNTIVLLSIAGKPWWWIILFFIPVVNFIVVILVYIDLAKAFGQGTLFGILMIFLAPILILYLAFGPPEYVGV